MTLLNNLQKRNDSLKSKLRHEQLKYGTYSFKKFNKEVLLILNAYKHHKSILKAASSVGVDKGIAMKWFIEGMNKDSEFRSYYLAINRINGLQVQSHDDIISPRKEIRNKSNFSEVGNSWVYTMNVDGENISFASNNLNNLRQKVNNQNLPLL